MLICGGGAAMGRVPPTWGSAGAGLDRDEGTEVNVLVMLRLSQHRRQQEDPVPVQQAGSRRDKVNPAACKGLGGHRVWWGLMGSLLQRAHHWDPRRWPGLQQGRSEQGATPCTPPGRRGRHGSHRPSRRHPASHRHLPSSRCLQPHSGSCPRRKRRRMPTAMTLMKAVCTQRGGIAFLGKTGILRWLLQDCGLHCKVVGLWQGLSLGNAAWSQGKRLAGCAYSFQRCLWDLQ